MYSTLILLTLCVSLVIGRLDIEYQKAELRNRPKSLISIETELGTLIGYKQQVKSVRGAQNSSAHFNVFYGVPYAEPPIGKLRFRKTKLIERFPADPYAALEFKPHCAQPFSKKFHAADRFEEDCLYANIWAPNLEDARDADGKCKRLSNVMIYIFGGKGSVYLMTPYKDENPEADYLFHSGQQFAQQNTILFVLNYRLDLFAMLNLENEFSGNLALFDQNLAIQFVKKHIRSFCGDDQNLTLFGHSLGSMLLGMHLISKYSRNLISNAILQSGTALFNEFTPVTKNELQVTSFLAIIQLGCVQLSSLQIDAQELEGNRIEKNFFYRSSGKYRLNEKLVRSALSRNRYMFESRLEGGQESGEMVELAKLVRFLAKYVDLECVRTAPKDRVIAAGSEIGARYLFYFDSDFISQEDFLNYKLFNKLKLNPNVSLLIGALSLDKEGFEADLMRRFYTDQFNAPVVPKQEIIEYTKTSDVLTTDKKDFLQRTAEFYANESRWQLPNGYVDGYVNLKNDDKYLCPNLFYSNQAALSAKSVSNYILSYKFTRHVMTSFVRFDLTDYSWLSSAHADELSYVFGLPFRVPNAYTDLDRAYSWRLIELWTQFARTGRMPNQSNGSEWPVANAERPTPRYVEVTASFVRERKFEFEERCEQFFRLLLPIHQRPSYN